MWQVCLLVKYNIKVKSVSVCVSLSLWLVAKKSILIYLQRTCWHHEFEMTGSVVSWVTTMIRILRDFKPILNLDIYGEHIPKERITGSKIDLNLSAMSTYTWVYTVGNSAEFENDSRLNREPVKRFQKWDRMGKPRWPCDNPNLAVLT